MGSQETIIDQNKLFSADIEQTLITLVLSTFDNKSFAIRWTRL